ncbi:MAG: glycogen-binding domain-containing protein [Gemmatimonadota bacterium]
MTKGGRTLPCALATLALLATSGSVTRAQNGQSPVAPSSTIGPVTDAPTFSVLGLASLPDGNQMAGRNEVWFGATQPLGQLGSVRFAAIGSGNWRVRNTVGSNSAYEGIAALRARTRVGKLRMWSAVSYGHIDVDGTAGGGLLPGRTANSPPLDGVRADTTVSSRVDVGNIGRAEAGVISNVSGVELSFGFSVERATRVTTQTLTINVDNGLPPVASATSGGSVETRTIRGLQRRDIATGIAAMGFNTGSASWLVSLTSPVATWITKDDLSPKPRVAPAIASLAVVQRVSGWLSVVGAASTNSGTVGTSVMRDDIAGSRKSFAPVVALGFRIAHLPFRNRSDDTPQGILSFETRTIGGIDSASVMQTAPDSAPRADADTLRVFFLIDAPKAEIVELMGDATGWAVTQMQRTPNGRWRAELKLTPGLHRLTVRADGGRWIAPPGHPVGNDDYGSPVGVITVKGKQ